MSCHGRYGLLCRGSRRWLQQRCGATLRFGDLRAGQHPPHRLEELWGQRTAAVSCANEPRERFGSIVRHSGAQVISGAEHRLAVRITARRRLPPPHRSCYGIAFCTERVMEDHAKTGHRSGVALGCSELRKTPRLFIVGGYRLAFKEHPAQHVLSGRIALCRCHAVKLSSAHVILRDALSLEIGGRKIALSHRIACIRGQLKPTYCE